MIRRTPRLLAATAVLLGAACLDLAPPSATSAATSTWSNPASTGPAADQFSAMAYDAATGTDVLFTSSGQTWTWNGTAWTQQTPAPPAVSPSARRWPAMAYDATHGVVVLFGGKSGSTFLNDTWTWNGSTWTQHQPPLSPPARFGASLAWDTGAGRALLFGGYQDVGVFYADTWAWDGSAWNELVANDATAAAGPSPRAQAQMSEDDANSTVVLFGGASAAGALGDTWVWFDAKGTVGRWTQVSPAASPSARNAGAIAYSTAAKAPVLFGGSDASGTLLQDTWTWDGGGWAQASPTGQPPARQEAAAGAAPGGGTVMFGGVGSGGTLADTWAWSGSIDNAALPAATVLSCPPAGPSPSTFALPTATGTGTLRGASAVSHPAFSIAAALPSWEQMDAVPEEQIVSGTHFNTIASTNQMYWSADEPQEGIFNFCDGDQFVAMAQAYHQSIRLHNLITAGVNQNQTPNWINKPSIPWTAATLTAAMQQAITTTVNHYKGRIHVYTVAGEALDDNGNPNNNVFTQYIGYPKWVEEAFNFAHAADPTATLLYDDYNDYYDANPAGTPKSVKKTNTIALVNDLIANSHIDGVGIELFDAGSSMLPGSGQVQSASLAAAMSTFGALNNGAMQTAITQMTVPYFTDTPSAAVLTQQAQVYAYALNSCLQPASHCFMLSTWGLADDGGPAGGVAVGVFDTPTNPAAATTAPWGGTLIDDTYRPKLAYQSMLAVLQMTAPSLTATASAGQVALSWTASSDCGPAISGYEVYRGTSTEQETPYQALGASATAFTDTAVTSGTTYYYRVSAVNSTGDGQLSNEVPATP